MSKNGFGKFLAGAIVGAGIGLLFAPKSGKENREILGKAINNLADEVKGIDKEEVKKEFNKKLDELKSELADLDKEKALKIAKEKSLELKDKAQELVDLAIDKGTPVLRDAAEDVRLKTIEVTKKVLKKLEETEVK